MRRMHCSLRDRWHSMALREKAIFATLTVLVGMVLVGVLTSIYINAINHRASRQNVDNQFDAVQRTIGKQLTTISDALHVVGSDNNTYILAALYEMNAQTHEKDYIEKLQRIQQSILLANRDFSSIDLILVRGDKVVSNDYVCDVNYYIHRNQLADLHLRMQQAYRQHGGLSISPSLYDDNMVAMSMIQHLYMPNSYFAVALNVSRNAIEMRLADAISDTQACVYLLTPLGDLYGRYDGTGLRLATADVFELYARQEEQVNVAGHDMHVRRAEIGSLRLVALYPQTDMAGALRSTTVFLLVTICLFSLLAILLYMELRNSFVTSAQALLSKYGQLSPEAPQRNEYSRIDTMLQSMLTSIKSMEQRVKEAEEALSTGSQQVLDDLTQCVDAFAAEQPNMRFTVFILVIEDAEGLFQPLRCRAWILALQRRWHAQQFFDRNNTVMGLIAFDADDEPTLMELAKLLETLMPEDGFLRIGVSARYASIDEVWRAYEEARIAFEWNDGGHSPVLIQPFEPRMKAQQGVGFVVTLKMQSILANAALTSDVAGMRTCLDTIYDENRHLNHYWQRRLSGHLLDLLLVFSQNKGAMDSELVHGHLAWLSSRNTTLLKQRVYQYYTALTEIPMEQEDELIGRIRLYVEGNLGEDISLTDVAAHVGLSYNYVSTRFSEAFGINFSSYLLNSRLKKAKALLQETDMPIAEVGRQVGYHVTSSFIRLFKKHTGIPPGAFRDMIQNGSLQEETRL